MKRKKQFIIRKQDKFKDGRSRYVIETPEGKILRLGKPEKLYKVLKEVGYWD